MASSLVVGQFLNRAYSTDQLLPSYSAFNVLISWTDSGGLNNQYDMHSSGSGSESYGLCNGVAMSLSNLSRL